jgi:inward rectifier potassium channel
MRRAFWADLYHSLLLLSWPRFLVGVLLGYIATNLAFASLFRLGGDCIHNGRPGSWADAFYLSVQTFGTIGYGYLSPATDYANLVVAVEAMVSMLWVALVTGLVFARFARPTARVIWSRHAVVTMRDGQRTLQVRVANERGNQIAEAQILAALSMDEVTAEGESIRRVHDVRLTRERNLLFIFSWTIIHVLDDTSPFAKASPEDLRVRNATLLVSLTGLDDVLGQTVHSRHIYAATEILWGARHADILLLQPDGSRIVDYHRFHDVEPSPLVEA